MLAAVACKGVESKLSKFDTRIIFLKLHIRPLLASGWPTSPMDTQLMKLVKSNPSFTCFCRSLMRSLSGSCVDGRLKIRFNRFEFFNAFKALHVSLIAATTIGGGIVGVGVGGSSSSSTSGGSTNGSSKNKQPLAD
ncbi:hypothetical protein T10_8033 [Trichinella papuae]|uniref:Uncharacterized protein n=1 Tax=Trichinella papuae TaxID=268474 RepID=A0A0V1M6M7_9BILA|nr:hypothetical protein T10_8033 [Trichinella papuae]